ncbi:MAG: hypothetical protein K2P18_02155 [Oscillospiraceae bacterium]|nr:hypothetical protein [Oscillospiraceae bacterium]
MGKNKKKEYVLDAVLDEETYMAYKNLYSQPRMPAGRGIVPSGKANFRRNTLCIARKFNAAWRKKTRPDGV